jgi:hypothetical protein
MQYLVCVCDCDFLDKKCNFKQNRINESFDNYIFFKKNYDLKMQKTIFLNCKQNGVFFFFYKVKRTLRESFCVDVNNCAIPEREEI